MLRNTKDHPRACDLLRKDGRGDFPQLDKKFRLELPKSNSHYRRIIRTKLQSSIRLIAVP